MRFREPAESEVISKSAATLFTPLRKRKQQSHAEAFSYQISISFVVKG